jgi:tRNA dimethylallyltransferase
MAASAGPERSHNRIPVLVIGGPTCSGKSWLAIEMAKRFNGEIISADSRQIYRQIKIGTDRLDPDQRQGITHHLMGTIDLDQRFTAFDFVREADRLIEDIHRRDKKVIICGGTGLYLRALIDGIFEVPEDGFAYRNELLDIAAREGPGFVYKMLCQVDPEEAAAVHPNNVVKVVRALEIHHITGRTKTELNKETRPKNKNVRFLYLVLLPKRDRLYELIEERVERMTKAGLVAEAGEVYASEYGDSLRNRKILGYAELIEHFEGEISLDEALNRIRQNTRRFAKRQYTWFRGFKKAEMLPSFGPEAAEACVNLAETFWGQASSD